MNGKNLSETMQKITDIMKEGGYNARECLAIISTVELRFACLASETEDEAKKGLLALHSGQLASLSESFEHYQKEAMQRENNSN